MIAFTIVIAIRNAAKELATTLDSLDAQSFRNIEVIIADCNSTDDPGKYLHNRPYSIQHIVQDDKGIYDAWNKVLPQAQGEWVSFMGAGDQYSTEQTLAQVAEILNTVPNETLLAYGRVDVVGENGKVLSSSGLPWPSQLQAIAGFGAWPHQAMFQRRRSFLDHGYFDSSFAITGDLEMVLRLSKIREPVFFELDVAQFGLGGVCSKPSNKLHAMKEYARALRRHNIRARNSVFTLWKSGAVVLLSQFVPQRVMHVMIDHYRHLTGRKPRFR
jgi:glycosyltransferase involved in cell wall biosynthesis